MTSSFLIATTKNNNFVNKEAQSKLEIVPKFFLFFFQPQIEFGTQTIIFQKKNCVQNFFVHYVVA